MYERDIKLFRVKNRNKWSVISLNSKNRSEAKQTRRKVKYESHPLMHWKIQDFSDRRGASTQEGRHQTNLLSAQNFPTIVSERKNRPLVILHCYVHYVHLDTSNNVQASRPNFATLYNLRQTCVDVLIYWKQESISIGCIPPACADHTCVRGGYLNGTSLNRSPVMTTRCH